MPSGCPCEGEYSNSLIFREGAFSRRVTVHVELLHVVHNGCGVEGLLGKETKTRR